MINNLPIYEVTLDSEVFNISLVEDPAIEEDFVYFEKQNSNIFLFENNEQKLICGPVLIPEKPIYRIDKSGKDFYLKFSKEVIKKLCYDFLLNGFYQNFTIDHEKDVNDISIVENWIKENENDKSYNYGFDLPNGTWFAICKINNDEVWQKIKSGEVKAFSVESFVKLNEINNLNMQKENLEQIDVNESFWSKLREIISDALGLKPKDEVVVDEMAKCNPDDEDEKKKKVEMEVIEKVKDEAVIDVAENVEEKILTEQDKIDTLQKVIDELQAKLNELTSEMEAKNAEIEQLKEKNLKLSKQPSVNPNVKGNKNETKYSFLDYAQGKIKY